MKRLFSIFALCAIMGFVCSSCSESEEPSNFTEYDKSELKQEFAAEDSSAESKFEFNAAEAWSASVASVTKVDAPSWVTIYPESGSAGANEITITIAEENTTSESRSAMIVIVSGSSKIEIAVRQRAVGDDSGNVGGGIPDDNVNGVITPDYNDLAKVKSVKLYYEDNNTFTLGTIMNVAYDSKGNIKSLCSYAQDEGYRYYSKTTFNCVLADNKIVETMYSWNCDYDLFDANGELTSEALNSSFDPSLSGEVYTEEYTLNSSNTLIVANESTVKYVDDPTHSGTNQYKFIYNDGRIHSVIEQEDTKICEAVWVNGNIEKLIGVNGDYNKDQGNAVKYTYTDKKNLTNVDIFMLVTGMQDVGSISEGAGSLVSFAYYGERCSHLPVSESSCTGDDVNSTYNFVYEYDAKGLPIKITTRDADDVRYIYELEYM